ncbi:GWxTD domain-containing protein [Balneolaceae bacterium ANBcel3]|nr:GWxTD domain-containing protein [Balneolaceae bacterium ANBcel3]
MNIFDYFTIYGTRVSIVRTTLILILLLILSSFDLASAQRITYESLRMRPDIPNAFVDYHIVPATGQHGYVLVTTFRMGYDYMEFRRSQQGGFSAEPHVRMNIFKEGTSPSERLSGEPFIREVWNQTITVEEYEKTGSRNHYVQSLIERTIEPGKYHLTTELSPRSGSPSSPPSQSRQRRSPRSAAERPSPSLSSMVTIPEPGDTSKAFFYLLEHSEDVSSARSIPLLNFGRNTLFGEDHSALIWIPEKKEGHTYVLEIDQLRIRRGDTTHVRQVFSDTLDHEKMLSGYRHRITENKNKVMLQLDSSESTTGRYYLVSIPNSRFENAHFKMRLKHSPPESAAITLAEKVYFNLWLNMPVSLLNLDIAVEMMEFIMDSDAHRTMRRASSSDKEQKFRAFWKERDPDPETEYNPLMVEYFRRIDEAYDRFTTPQVRGFESDQGKVFLRNGEPDRKERVLPPGQPAREIWHYGSRRFVFEATTGFGDYRLVEQR